MNEKNENPCYGNPFYGSGQHGHEVPALEGRVVLMRDGSHKGTEIYRVEGGFRFVSLDWEKVSTAERCVLVRLTGSMDLNDLPEPYGCDLESPDGLALVGLDASDSTLELGEVLWDSHVAYDAWNAYRYPTEAEIAAGREDFDMVHVGHAATKAEAEALLKVAGQLQFGRDGEVVHVEAG